MDFAADFFLVKNSMKPTRESQALVVLNFAANVSTFERLILAEEIRTCAKSLNSTRN